MFLGHLATGLAAKPAAPKAPVLVLPVASEVPELMFFALQAVDIEKQAVSTTMDWKHKLPLWI